VTRIRLRSSAVSSSHRDRSRGCHRRLVSSPCQACLRLGRGHWSFSYIALPPLAFIASPSFSQLTRPSLAPSQSTGLGHTGTLISLYMIKNHEFTAVSPEAGCACAQGASSARSRPGQAFLCAWEALMRRSRAPLHLQATMEELAIAGGGAVATQARGTWTRATPQRSAAGPFRHHDPSRPTAASRALCHRRRRWRRRWAAAENGNGVGGCVTATGSNARTATGGKVTQASGGKAMKATGGKANLRR
jgi:hypothetical protein